MAKKPTYKELGKKVKELEKAAIESQKTMQMLKESEESKSTFKCPHRFFTPYVFRDSHQFSCKIQVITFGRSVT